MATPPFGSAPLLQSTSQYSVLGNMTGHPSRYYGHLSNSNHLPYTQTQPVYFVYQPSCLRLSQPGSFLNTSGFQPMQPTIRTKLPNSQLCHRLVIQGSSLNYKHQTSSVLPTTANLSETQNTSYHTSHNCNGNDNTSQIKVADLTVCGQDDSGYISASSDSHISYSYRTIQEIQKQKAASNDFSNLDLLSTVSLLQESTETEQKATNPLDFPKKDGVHVSRVGECINNKNNFQESTKVVDTCCNVSVSRDQAKALGLVPITVTTQPTVWLNVTLQVDTGSEVKQGQPGVHYRSLITNIVTQYYYPPKLSPPGDMVKGEMTASVSYDDRGRLTVLQVEFITAGIYKVKCTGESPKRPRSAKSNNRSVILTRIESLEVLPPGSQYFILGDLCPVPKTFQKCHRNAKPVIKKITGYLYSREFLKYTLPLLLENGEEDVWSTSLKVPLTRSRVSDYDDLAVGEQSLKRKASPSRHVSQDGVKCLIPPKRRRKSRNTSAEMSPQTTLRSVSPVSVCSSPTSSVTSLPEMMSDDSCDTYVFHQEPLSSRRDPPRLEKEICLTNTKKTNWDFPPVLKPVLSQEPKKKT